MKKDKMITRTIEECTATFLCLNVETAEVSTIDYPIPGGKTVDDAIKYARKYLETDTLKIAHCTGVKLEEVLYGVPESLFRQFATRLEPRK